MASLVCFSVFRILSRVLDLYILKHYITVLIFVLYYYQNSLSLTETHKLFWLLCHFQMFNQYLFVITCCHNQFMTNFVDFYLTAISEENGIKSWMCWEPCWPSCCLDWLSSAVTVCWKTTRRYFYFLSLVVSCISLLYAWLVCIIIIVISVSRIIAVCLLIHYYCACSVKF